MLLQSGSDYTLKQWMRIALKMKVCVCGSLRSNIALKISSETIYGVNGIQLAEPIDIWTLYSVTWIWSFNELIYNVHLPNNFETVFCM